MIKPLDSNLVIDKKYYPFLFIVFFVFLNAFYNSLASAYGLNHFPFDTFLFYPSDLHADLIKMSMGYFPNHPQLDVSSWDPIYRNFYQLHIQGWFKAHHFNNAHMPPFSFVLGWLTSKLLLATSPTIVIAVYYSIIFVAIASIARFFTKSRIGFLIVSVTLLVSYPMLFVLTRGNIFAFFNGILLVTFLYLIIRQKSPLVAIFLLAVSMNIHPNVVLLTPLFFVYSPPRAIKYIFATVIVGAMLFGFFLWLAHRIDTQYTLMGFFAGLKNYTQLYILGNFGMLFNNSLYGAIRTFLIAWEIEPSASFLLLLNKFIIGGGLIALLLALHTFIKKRLTPYEFAFVVMAIYTLTSTVFATYHLIPYATFLLMPLIVKDTDKLSEYNLTLIQTASVFMLIPKNYLFIDYMYKNFLSIETLFNPLVLLSVLIIIFSRSFKRSTKCSLAI